MILDLTVLHTACERSHIKAVETLLSLGADPCIANKHWLVLLLVSACNMYNISVIVNVVSNMSYIL